MATVGIYQVNIQIALDTVLQYVLAGELVKFGYVSQKYDLMMHRYEILLIF